MPGMNPTGGEVRRDKWGDGRYGAPRSSGSTKRKHLGHDCLGMPGQWVVAPEDGEVTGTDFSM